MTKASSAPAFNPYEIYDVNEDYEVDGIWFVDPLQRYKLARAGGRNKLFTSVHDAITKPFKRAIQTKTLPKDMDLELSHELYAKAVVKNWSVAELVKDEKTGRMVAKKDENGKVVWIDGKMFDPETFEVIDATVENIIRAYKAKNELYTYHVQMSNEVQNFKDEDAEGGGRKKLLDFLEYRLEYGDNEIDMISNGLRGFGKMPDPIANAPDLWPWLHPYYMAFETLSPERPKDSMAGTIGIIPWSKIDRYCTRSPWMDFDTTLLYIRTLDFRYVEWVRNLKANTPAAQDEEGKVRPPKRTKRIRN